MGCEDLDGVAVVCEDQAKAQAVAVPFLVAHDAVVSVACAGVVVCVEPARYGLGYVSAA